MPLSARYTKFEQVKVFADTASTRERAEALAARLTAHWQARGYDVKFWAESAHDNGGLLVWSVRSDLVRGQPQRALIDRR